jgi:hypothetical protein
MKNRDGMMFRGVSRWIAAFLLFCLDYPLTHSILKHDEK